MRRGSFLFIFYLLFVFSSCSRSQAYKKEIVLPQSGAYEREEALTGAKKFSSPKKRTIVLPFWNDTPVKGSFSRSAQSTLKDIFNRHGQLNVVHDFKVPQKSKDFYLDKENINLESLIKLGSSWAVSLIAIGRISEIVFRKADEEVGLLRPSASKAAANVEVRLIDVASGKEAVVAQTVGLAQSSSINLFGENAEDNKAARAEVVEMAIADGLQRAMPLLEKEIDRIVWRGRIAKIIGGKIFINAGRATGLHLGDILKVTTSGADVFDPETGIHIGRTEGEIKGTLELVDYFSEDGSVARIHSGGNFQENDIVQLYP